MADTPDARRPDAALVLESDAYVGLLTGSRGLGAAGLFAFCVDAAYFATNVLMASPDFSGYFGANRHAVG